MRNDDDHNLYVDSYKVQWKKGSGSWETPADVTEAGYAPSGPRFFEGYVISGLTPGVEYDVRVIATNAVGDSEPSNVASGMVEPNSSGQQSNSPARGGPGIQGTPRTGETLTATTSSIRDDDGLDNAVFAYQWVRSELGAKTGTDIAGATGPSYVVTDDDEGKAITVLVTFKDDAGNRGVGDQQCGGGGHGAAANPGPGRAQRAGCIGPRQHVPGRGLDRACFRRRLGHHRLQGAVEGGGGQLGNARGRIGSGGARDQPYHHRADRRHGILGARPGHQRRRREPTFGGRQWNAA